MALYQRTEGRGTWCWFEEKMEVNAQRAEISKPIYATRCLAAYSNSTTNRSLI